MSQEDDLIDSIFEEMDGINDVAGIVEWWRGKVRAFGQGSGQKRPAAPAAGVKEEISSPVRKGFRASLRQATAGGPIDLDGEPSPGEGRDSRQEPASRSTMDGDDVDPLEELEDDLGLDLEAELAEMIERGDYEENADGVGDE